MGMESIADERARRRLTPSERGLAVVIGAVMLMLAFVSLASTVSVFVQFNRLVEGLSK
jgi:hypothetical protein